MPCKLLPGGCLSWKRAIPPPGAAFPCAPPVCALAAANLSQPCTPYPEPRGAGEAGLPLWRGGWPGVGESKEGGEEGKVSREKLRQDCGMWTQVWLLGERGKPLPGILRLCRGGSAARKSHCSARAGPTTARGWERRYGNRGSFCPTKPCLVRSEHLQGWRLQGNPSGQLAPRVVTLKVLFLTFNWNFLVFNGSPLPPVLSLASAERSLAPSSLPPQQTSDPPEPSPLQAEQTQLTQPFLTSRVLQTLKCLCGLCWTHSSPSISLLPWEAQPWTQCSRCASPGLSRSAG